MILFSSSAAAAAVATSVVVATVTVAAPESNATSSAIDLTVFDETAMDARKALLIRSRFRICLNGQINKDKDGNLVQSE